MTSAQLAYHLAVLDGRTPFRPSPLSILRPSQVEGASVLANRIERWRSAVLADPVGSGKSFTAIGTAALMDGDPTVICPASLVPQWQRLLDAHLPGTELISDGLLSRREVRSSLDGLVIVDEGHRFRSRSTHRRRRLVSLVGLRRVLWLTATPVWNSRSDLLSLIRVTVGPVLFRDAVGATLEEVDSRVDRCDRLWGAVCDRFVLRRKARVIRGRQESRWTARAVPSVVAVAAVAAAQQAMVLPGEPTQLFACAIARRLASSAEAAAETLERAERFLARLEDAQRSGGTLSRSEFRSTFGGELLGPTQTVFPFWYAPGALDGPDLASRRAAVSAAAVALREHPMEASEKADVLLSLVENSSPTIVFTEFRASADALWCLVPREASAVLVTGAGARVRGVGHVSVEQGLEAFRKGIPDLGFQSRVLVATPVATEGLNLQRADRVIHFDLPWNDARLEQRVGRADRIGGTGTVEIVTLGPPAELEELCDVAAAVARKRRLATVIESDAGPPTVAELPIRERLELRFTDGSVLFVGPEVLWAEHESVAVSPNALVARFVSGEKVSTTAWTSAPRPALVAPLWGLRRVRALERAGDLVRARELVRRLDYAIGSAGEGGIADMLLEGSWGDG